MGYGRRVADCVGVLVVGSDAGFFVGCDGEVWFVGGGGGRVIGDGGFPRVV